MKKTVFLVSVFLFFCLGCSAQSSIEEKNNPAGTAEKQDPNVWDFGKVKENQILKHAFVLKNDSAKPLKIKEVNTSCGCTASEAKKSDLLPGESTLIEVSFDSKGYSGETKQFIYVHTDSLENPIIRFIIKADVAK